MKYIILIFLLVCIPVNAKIEQTNFDPIYVYGDIDDNNFVFGCQFQNPMRGIAMNQDQDCEIFAGELNEKGIPTTRLCTMTEFSILLFHLNQYQNK